MLRRPPASTRGSAATTSCPRVVVLAPILAVALLPPRRPCSLRPRQNAARGSAGLRRPCTPLVGSRRRPLELFAQRLAPTDRVVLEGDRERVRNRAHPGTARRPGAPREPRRPPGP